MDSFPSCFFSEVILGENTVGKDPDCETCPSVIRRKINKDRDIIVHEGFNRRRGKKATRPERYANDIGRSNF